MPLFKGSGHKSKPNKAIAYITDKNKAVIISSQAMDDTQSYAKQFMQTRIMFGKGSGYDERKYYHFKVSPDPADNVTPEISHQLAQELAERLFPSHECVIATHNDTDVIHSHILVNSVNFETGKKLHLNDKEYRNCKDMANTLAVNMGLTPLDWRTLTKEKRAKQKQGINDKEAKSISYAERQIGKRANLETASWAGRSACAELLARASWKEALRLAIDEAKAHCYDRASFESYLKNNYGVEMPRNTGKTISFRHPAVEKPIRGVKLGGDYTADSIDIALQINHERSLENARLRAAENAESSTATATPIRPIGGYEPKPQNGNRKRLAPRSISDVGAELRSLDETVGRIASSVPTGDESGDSDITAEPPARNNPTESVHAKPLEPVEEYERIVQPKPKRRAVDHGR